MAVILPFIPKAPKWRSIETNPGKPAIIIFPGVRYEKGDRHGPANGGPQRPPPTGIRH